MKGRKNYFLVCDCSSRVAMWERRLVTRDKRAALGCWMVGNVGKEWEHINCFDFALLFFLRQIVLAKRKNVVENVVH